MEDKKGKLPITLVVGIITLAIGAVAGYGVRIWLQPAPSFTPFPEMGAGGSGGGGGRPGSGGPLGGGSGGPPGGGGGRMGGMMGGGGGRMGGGGQPDQQREEHPNSFALTDLIQDLGRLQGEENVGLSKSQAAKLKGLLTGLAKTDQITEQEAGQHKEQIDGVLTPDQKTALEEDESGGFGGMGGGGGGRSWGGSVDPLRPFESGRNRNRLLQRIGELTIQTE